VLSADGPSTATNSIRNILWICIGVLLFTFLNPQIR
jgi:hypothetical protein